MRKILALLVLPLACGVVSAQTPPSAARNCPIMEVSIVADGPGDSVRKISSTDGRSILLTEKPLLTTPDFAAANVSLTEGQIGLDVTMTDDGAKRMQAFTASHVGKTIAFVVNGRVIKAPRIVDPTTGNGFLITPFHRDEAQKLADSINHKDRGCGIQSKSPR